MRWKLILIASLFATLTGTGAVAGLVFGLFGSAARLAALDVAALCTLLLPVGTIIAASIFVYRHTARRRSLQAMATLLLSCFLTLTVFLLVSLLAGRF